MKGLGLLRSMNDTIETFRTRRIRKSDGASVMYSHSWQWFYRHLLHALACVGYKTLLATLEFPKFRGANGERLKLEEPMVQVDGLQMF